MSQQSNSGNSNQLLVPGAAQAIDQMKYEIASEFGVNLDRKQLLAPTVLSVEKSQNVLSLLLSKAWAEAASSSFNHNFT